MTGKIVAKIPTGGDPHAILIAPDGRRGYVTVREKPQRINSSIFVLDLETGNIVDQIAGMGTRASDAMKRIAAPMIGGMVTSTILTLVIIPVIYDMWRGWQFAQTGATQTLHEGES